MGRSVRRPRSGCAPSGVQPPQARTSSRGSCPRPRESARTGSRAENAAFSAAESRLVSDSPCAVNHNRPPGWMMRCISASQRSARSVVRWVKIDSAYSGRSSHPHRAATVTARWLAPRRSRDWRCTSSPAQRCSRIHARMCRADQTTSAACGRSRSRNQGCDPSRRSGVRRRPTPRVDTWHAHDPPPRTRLDLRCLRRARAGGTEERARRRRRPVRARRAG